MYRRKILVIHTSSVVRIFLKRHILAELNDVDIVETDSGKRALEILKVQNIDAVLSYMHLKGMSGIDLFRAIRSESSTENTAFILLVSTLNDTLSKELFSLGIEHFLSIPINSISLSKKINEVCDPKNQRVHARYYIPGTRAVLHLDSGDIYGDVKNISKNGVLVEIDHAVARQGLMKSLYLTLQFPRGYLTKSVKEIWSKLTQLSVVTWSGDFEAEKVQIVWQFLDISEENSNHLSAIFKQLEHEDQGLENLDV